MAAKTEADLRREAVRRRLAGESPAEIAAPLQLEVGLAAGVAPVGGEVCNPVARPAGTH